MFYYGLVDTENNSFGFLEASDVRVTSDMIPVSRELWNQLLDEQSEGKEIVFYNGEVFTAEPGRYYVDASGVWQKKSDQEFVNEQLQLQNERRKNEILSELENLDQQAVRPLRAQTVGLATDDDIARLTEIEQQAAALRTEYRLLNSAQ